MKRKILLVTLLINLFFVKTTIAQKIQQQLDSFFSSIDKNGDINGSILITEKGKVLYHKSFGYADIQNKIPNTENTLFQIASVSKLFTAIAILQLEEQKKLNLNDKFTKYFSVYWFGSATQLLLLTP